MYFLLLIIFEFEVNPSYIRLGVMPVDHILTLYVFM